MLEKHKDKIGIWRLRFISSEMTFRLVNQMNYKLLKILSCLLPLRFILLKNFERLAIKIDPA